MEEKKQKKGTAIVIILLIVIILGLVGYICYDKKISKIATDNSAEKKQESKNASINENKYNTYKIGDKVVIKLNDYLEQSFYVLKNSSSEEDNVTLFSEKNIGTSAFNNDYSDGNEFNGSLIQSKLNELTSSWTNVKEKRLVTVDELKQTGLTTKEQCGPSNEICETINGNSWLKHQSEMYWTMTKAISSDNTQYDDGKYVYYVDLNGVITGSIVGYSVGSEWNKDGNAFKNYGIRPVIEISKKYITEN